ncbi:hypothetical protein D3C72_1842500 [compost metagenome]
MRALVDVDRDGNALRARGRIVQRQPGAVQYFRHDGARERDGSARQGRHIAIPERDLERLRILAVGKVRDRHVAERHGAHRDRARRGDDSPRDVQLRALRLDSARHQGISRNGRKPFQSDVHFFAQKLAHTGHACWIRGQCDQFDWDQDAVRRARMHRMPAMHSGNVGRRAGR